MPRIDWRLVLKGLAGFAVGIAVWALLTPVYDRLVAASTERVMRAFENPPVTRLRPKEDGFTTVDREDFDRRSK